MSITAQTTIARALEVLFEPGAVAELRAIRNGKTAAGYFDDPEALAREAGKLDGQEYTVYVTANPVDPALLARSQNRVKHPLRESTSDRDILRRRWLLVDLDPARPAGVSATDEEKNAARERAREIYAHLHRSGWSEPVIGDSGNGYHLLYPIDLPNDPESLELVRGVLEALSFRFTDERVSVDTTTSNAARIWKLYGTTARKGDSTEERPHRPSGLLKVPEGLPEERVEVSRELLSAMAASSPEPPRRSSAGGDRRVTPGKEFDIREWIERHSVPVKREGPWKNGGWRWVLEACPWNGHTDNAAYIVQQPTGEIGAGCQHNSCQVYDWRDLREHYEPDAYQRNGHESGGRESAAYETPEEPEDWVEPVPLPDEMPPVAPFDPEMLPAPLRRWVADIAERMQIPADFCAAGAVVLAGSLVGRKFGLHPKRHDDWLVVPNLWGAVVGRPAMLKSPALAEVMKPLARLLSEARESHEARMVAYERAVSMHKAEAKALEKDLEAAAREAVKNGDRGRLEAAAQRQQESEPPEEPVQRRYKTEDPTTEKLCELLLENPNGMLVHRDELSGWLRTLDKQGREGDRSLYLEAWNGTGSYEVDRIGRGSLYVPALCVSILGGIQPGPLSNYVWAAAQGGEGADGLLQRFQILVWPDPPKSFSKWTAGPTQPPRTAPSKCSGSWTS